MSETISQKKLNAAIDFGFLSSDQVESLEHERLESDDSILEIATRTGLLNREQQDIVNIFAEPENVVPGYRIDGFLGEGGVGTVYKATQIRMDRPVAIKTIHHSAARNDLTLKRFEQEARIIGQLRHPNIIPAFDFGLHEEKLYLIMEFVDGIDAEHRLSQNSLFPEKHAWFIARQVCHALHNAKQLGIIHRDIKPANLILMEAPAGTPMPAGVPFAKVADFGLAKFSNRKKDAKITLDEAINGTPFYMSPEQIQSLDIDHRSDIYSLGITIWHLILGSPPVTGTGPLDVITKKMNLEDGWLKQTDEMSEKGFQLLSKMCRHDREQRIDDYSELSQEIDAVIESLADPEPQENPDAVITADSSPSANITTIREMAMTLADHNAGDVSDSLDFVLGEQGFVLGDQDSVSDSPVESDRFAANAGRTQNSMPKFEGGYQSSRRGRSRPLWSGVFLFGLLSIAAMFVASNFKSEIESESSTRESDVNNPRVVLSEFAGLPIPLLSGTQPDATQKSSGTWELVKKSEDGSEVNLLSGLGTRDFRCRDSDGQPLQNFQFLCGFQHHEADLIEFKYISNEPDAANEKEMFSVAITPDTATLVFDDTKEEIEIQPVEDQNNIRSHQFRIESQRGFWRVEVDGELLGEIDKPKDHLGDDAIIELSIKGNGSAHFDKINLQKFANDSQERQM